MCDISKLKNVPGGSLLVFSVYEVLLARDILSLMNDVGIIHVLESLLIM